MWCWAWAAGLTINGRITVGDLVAYQALLIGLNSAIHNLTWMIPSFIEATAGWQRIREILDEPLGIQDRPGARDLARFSGSIDIEKVSFKYPTADVPTLNKVDLKIAAGEYVVFRRPQRRRQEFDHQSDPALL